MRRLAVATVLAISATTALANSPPPDRFGPCDGRQAGDACSGPLKLYEAGCTCVAVTEGCPGGAGTCLSCQSGIAWCGPTSYAPHETTMGCATGAPVAASLAGAAWLALLVRRRRAVR